MLKELLINICLGLVVVISALAMAAGVHSMLHQEPAGNMSDAHKVIYAMQRAL